MTLSALLRYVDGLKPNGFTDGQKTAWTRDLEAAVWTQIFLQSPGEWQPEQFTGGGPGQLLLPESWRRLYAAYLTAMMDLANGEFGRYANAMAIFNAAMQELGAWYAGRFCPASRPAAWARLGSAAYTAVSGSALPMAALPKGAAVLMTECRVTAAFDGAKNALTLGTARQPDALLAAADAKPGTAGVYRRAGLWLPAGADEALFARYTYTGVPAAGAAEFWALVQP